MSIGKFRSKAIAAGYRSGLEEKVGRQLSDAGVEAEYEPFRIEYEVPASKHKYTPDYVLPNGIIVETKGRFMAEDRKKHLLIQKQYPGLDIRFVFTNPNAKLRKGSPTSYADWCNKNGFAYASKLVPVDWVKEKPVRKSMELIFSIRNIHAKR
jgi:hypothetical protein